jgi:hypothetical protein
VQTHRLICHPSTSRSAVTSLKVTANRIGIDSVRIGFDVFGKMEAIAWPGDTLCADGPWERGDELWKHTCFEAFLRVPDQRGYGELNLATSGRWAAYRFSDYRSGMRDAENVTVHKATWRIRPHRAGLHAVMQLPWYSDEDVWAVGLSAVIEETDGTKSYWALRHPPGQPDFHHADCFALELAAPDII